MLGFAEQLGASRDEALATLDSGALCPLPAYPFLTGQVIKRGQTSTNSSIYKIIPYPPHQNKSPVRRKYCTELCPSYEEILKADAPFAMLDGNVISLTKGIGYQYKAGTKLPVFAIKANFIKGGLLLCFASMHNALYMNRHVIVLKMFAAAGRGEEFDSALVEAGNRDADTIVPLLRPGGC